MSLFFLKFFPGPKFFCLRFFFFKFFSNPKFFPDPKFFSKPKFFWDQKFLGTQHFFETQKFQTQNFSDPKWISMKTIFGGIKQSFCSWGFQNCPAQKFYLNWSLTLKTKSCFLLNCSLKPWTYQHNRVWLPVWYALQ